MLCRDVAAVIFGADLYIVVICVDVLRKSLNCHEKLFFMVVDEC